MLNNNIIDNNPYKHKTPLGAGTVIQANGKFILQPTIQELNNDKIQATITIIKAQ